MKIQSIKNVLHIVLFVALLCIILILDKIVIKEQRCAIIVKGDNYGEEIRNQRRRIE